MAEIINEETPTTMSSEQGLVDKVDNAYLGRVNDVRGLLLDYSTDIHILFDQYEKMHDTESVKIRGLNIKRRFDDMLQKHYLSIAQKGFLVPGPKSEVQLFDDSTVKYYKKSSHQATYNDRDELAKRIVREELKNKRGNARITFSILAQARDLLEENVQEDFERLGGEYEPGEPMSKSEE